MKKILLIVITMLFIFTGCNSNPKEEDLYITFTADSFELEYGANYDPLSDTYIKDTNGEVTFMPKFETTQSGEHTGTYTVTSLTNPEKTREYEVTFIVKEKTLYQFEGYPEKTVWFTSDNLEKGFDLNPSWTEKKLAS